jgi:hypothetical protein
VMPRAHWICQADPQRLARIFWENSTRNHP